MSPVPVADLKGNILRRPQKKQKGSYYIGPKTRHIADLEKHGCHENKTVYYIDTSVLLENMLLVNFIGN